MTARAQGNRKKLSPPSHEPLQVEWLVLVQLGLSVPAAGSRFVAIKSHAVLAEEDQLMGSSESKPGLIHLKIIEVMKRYPDGISGGQIRQELEEQGLLPEDQTHLDRRKRDLKKWFDIRKTQSSVTINGKERRVVLYQYSGKRQQVRDEGQINLKLRAEVIHGARGRCRWHLKGRAVKRGGRCSRRRTGRSIPLAALPSAFA